MRTYTEKTLNKYKQIVQQKNISESELIGLRSFINNKLRHDSELQDELVYSMTDKNLEQAHQKKGINWLTKTNLNKKGELKSSAFLGYREAAILVTATTVKLHSLFNMSYKGSNFMPAYTVYNNKGEGFSYQQQNDGTYKVFGYAYDPDLDLTAKIL